MKTSTEIFFVLTVIYAAYVIFVSVTDKEKPHVVDDSASAMFSVKTADVKPLIPENIKTKPLEKPVVAAKPAKESSKKAGLKNPQTGEIVTSYGNYRFMKRWIKETFVAENLLDKIYKNNELDAQIEEKIKNAIASLEANARYQA